MTGRELIIYILDNGLEDVDLFDKGILPHHISTDEAATQLDIGIASVFTLYTLGKLNGFSTNDKLYILQDEKYMKLINERGNDADNR